MHFKQLASRWEESETCLLPYRALNTICSFWSCCEGWLGHKAEGIWNFRVPGIKAFSLTPRLHDKKSCVKKPRASHPDFLTLFIKKLKGLACQTTLIVLYTTSEAACKQAHAHRTLFLQVLFSLSVRSNLRQLAGLGFMPEDVGTSSRTAVCRADRTTYMCERIARNLICPTCCKKSKGSHTCAPCISSTRAENILSWIYSM